MVLGADVSGTGGRVRAAMDVLLDCGRASTIQLGVVVERGRRELPLRADFVGKKVPTSIREVIKVSCANIDGEDSVAIFETDRAVR